MKYHVGARMFGTGRRLAEEVDASDFTHALNKAHQVAGAELGVGNYRLTALVEQPAEAGKDDPQISQIPTDKGRETPAAERRWSSLTFFDSAGEEDDEAVDIRIAHSTQFVTADEARKSSAA